MNEGSGLMYLFAFSYLFTDLFIYSFIHSWYIQTCIQLPILSTVERQNDCTEAI